MASTIHADGTQHWDGKAWSPSKGKWLKRVLGAALKRDRSTWRRYTFRSCRYRFSDHAGTWTTSKRLRKRPNRVTIEDPVDSRNLADETGCRTPPRLRRLLIKKRLERFKLIQKPHPLGMIETGPHQNQHFFRSATTRKGVKSSQQSRHSISLSNFLYPVENVSGSRGIFRTISKIRRADWRARFKHLPHSNYKRTLISAKFWMATRRRSTAPHSKIYAW